MAPPKSDIWKFFIRINKDTASCNICFKVLKTSGNTSNIKKHLNKHQQKAMHLPPGKKQQDETLVSDAVASTSKGFTPRVCDSVNDPVRSDASDEVMAETRYLPPPTKKSQLTIATYFKRMSSYSEGGNRHELITKCLLYFICVDKQPLETVNGRGFRRLLKHLSPTYKLPSVDTLKSRLDELYDVMIKVYYSKISDPSVENVAITLDIWTETMSCHSFLGITAHHLNGTDIVSKCIATKELTERHTSVYICEQLEAVCTKYSIPKSKVVCAVTDNASNIVGAVNMFLGKGKHLPCFAHTLHLVVEKVTSVENVQKITSRVRQVVKFFRRSVINSDLLRAKQIEVNKTPLKLILDVSTRWNSVYYMLERYVALSKFVHQILLENPKAALALTSVELDNVKHMLKLLQPLDYITKEIAGEKFVTLSKVIPLIHCLKAQLQSIGITAENDVVRQVKETLLSEINHRFAHIAESDLLAISNLLDPRFKNIHFIDIKACAKAQSNIRSLIRSEASSRVTDSDSTLNTESEYDFWSHHKVLAHGKQKNKTNTFEERDELSVYLSNPVSPLSSDPFKIWEDMKCVFPNLYKLARVYLTIPATSVPAERLFSKAGATVTQARNRLMGSHLEKLMFLGDCTEEEWEV